MSAKKFVTLAFTHDGKLDQIAGPDVPYDEQVDTIKKIRRSGQSHDKYAEVFQPHLLSGGYRFLAPAEAKKRADAIAKQQKEFERLQAAEKAEAERLAKLTPEQRQSEYAARVAAEKKAKADAEAKAKEAAEKSAASKPSSVETKGK